MKRVIICLVSCLCVIACFAKSKIETHYMQTGDSPIMEIHCVWTLEDGYLTKQQDAGSLVKMKIQSIKGPEEVDGAKIYEIECTTTDGLIKHKIVQSIPDDLTNNAIVIFDYSKLTGKHSISDLPLVKYSSQIF